MSAYIVNIGLPTLWVTIQLWFVYIILHMMRTSIVPMDASERMLRFGVTVVGVLGWFYIVASALNTYTPLVSMFAVIPGTILPMAYVVLSKEDPVVEDDFDEYEAPANRNRRNRR